LVAAIVILIGVVLASLGRAGEMADFASDTPPMELDEVSATDVALLRPPMSLWGYNAQATEDALRVIARSVTERDVEIATLRRELAELRGDLDGARAAGIGGPRVSPPALPARAREAYRPGLPGQAGPSAGDNDPESTITSVPGGQAQRASLPGAAATQPGGQAHDAGLPGAPGQADPPGPAGVPGQADPPGQATELPFWAWQRERGTDD
jgi:hypothetical protein